jgi:hypothetical protein
VGVGVSSAKTKTGLEKRERYANAIIIKSIFILAAGLIHI